MRRNGRDFSFNHLKPLHISRSVKKLFLDIIVLVAKSLIGIKKVTLYIAKKIAGIAATLTKRVAERPVIVLYKKFLGLKSQLNDLGIALKHPILYALSSKTLSFTLLSLLALLIVRGNMLLQEEEADIAGPNNIISQLVIAEEDRIFMEENDSLALNESDASLLSGVKAVNPMTPTSGILESTTDLNSISQNSGAIIKPLIPTTSEGTSSPDAIRTYLVQAGDTLSGISKRFGLRVNTILWANNLQTTATIREGQRLTILPIDGVLYRVKKGDSINKIAEQFDAEGIDIISYNRLAQNQSLQSGELIIIPGGQTSSSLASAANPKPKTIVNKIKEILNPKAIKDTTIGKNISRALGMVWPTTANRITQYFSWRHSGVDIAGPISNKIVAAGDGVVVISGWQNGYGNTVVIDHGNGTRTRYGHASKLFVSVGETVQKGEHIAMVGSTGRSTGPHLHFEVVVNGKKVNPLTYVR